LGSVTETYERVRDALARQSQCLEHNRLAYHGFLVLAQQGDFAGAEDCRLRAVTSMEAGMDAYVEACRVMNEGRKANGTS